MCPSSWTIMLFRYNTKFVFLILLILFFFFNLWWLLSVKFLTITQPGVKLRPLVLSGRKRAPLILKSSTVLNAWPNPTWRAGTRHIFFDSGNEESPLFFLHEVRDWKFSPSFFSTVAPSCALIMREKMTDCLPDGILLESTPTSFWAPLMHLGTFPLCEVQLVG